MLSSTIAHYFILIIVIHCGGLYLDKITSVSQEISNQLFITAEQKIFSKQTKAEFTWYLTRP